MAAIVIDTGSMSVKAGFTNADVVPRLIFPTVVGEAQQQGHVPGGEMLVGDEALLGRGFSRLTYPVKDGIINRWDVMKSIWVHTFEKLDINSEHYPVLIADSHRSTPLDKEKILQKMFSELCVPWLFVADQAVLSLYAADRRTTGVVVEVGDAASNVVTIKNGQVIPHGCCRLGVAGKDCTEALATKLTEQNSTFNKPVVRLKVAEEIKQAFGRVSADYGADIEADELFSFYTLPNGQQIKISSERFMCAEGLFNPSVIGKFGVGIPMAVKNSIDLCGEELRDELYGSIVLCGGSTMFPGIVERLNEEMLEVAPEGVNFNIITPEHREYAAWCGGVSLVETLGVDQFLKSCITLEDYNKKGPEVVHDRCSSLPL